MEDGDWGLEAGDWGLGKLEPKAPPVPSLQIPAPQTTREQPEFIYLSLH